MAALSKKSARSASRGVTILEFALVMPVLMMLVLLFSDLARMLVVKALLTKGAEDGVNLATKIPNLDLDIAGLAPSADEYRWFAEARRRVLDAALSTPLGTMLSDVGVSSSAKLLPYTIIDDALALPLGQTAPAITRGVGFLRPGEAILQGSPGVVVTHELRPPASPPNQLPSQLQLLRRYPFEVRLRAELDMFTPGFSNRVVEGRAVAYRELFIPPAPLPSPGSGGGSTSTTTTTTTTITFLYGPSTTTTTLCIKRLWDIVKICRAGTAPGDCKTCFQQVPDASGFCPTEWCSNLPQVPVGW